MRDITKDILALELFKYVELEEANTTHWDDPDFIIIRQNSYARLKLRIACESGSCSSYDVSLEVDELDSYGEVYLNDSLWFIYGTEAKILKIIQSKHWNPIDLQCYDYLFKNN